MSPILSHMKLAQNDFSWGSGRSDHLEREASWMEPFCNKSEAPLGRELTLSELRESKSHVH